MDEYRKNVQKVQKALNQDAAFIQPNPYLAQRVLNAANAENIGNGGMVVKKKIPVALIVAIVLMLSGVVALAATLMWQDYVPKMKQTEHEAGDYVEWPAEQRVQLAKDLVSMRHIHTSDTTAVLDSETASLEEKAAAADQLMLELTGLDDVKEVHSTLITYAIMGHEDTWTPEQRVWWNGIVTMYGDDGAPDTLLVPTADVLSEAEAVAIAKAELKKAYEFDDAYMAALHPVANLYVTEQRPDYKRWDIQFKKYREGSDTWAEKIYPVIVDEYGQVIADPDVAIEHPAERAMRANAQAQESVSTPNPEIQKVYTQYGSTIDGRSIWRLSLEEKATFLGDGNEIPENTAIPVPEAVEIAQARLADIGYDLASYEVSVWYQTCDATTDILSPKPVYRIYFLDDLDEPLTAFEVTVEADNGNVISTYAPEPMQAAAGDEHQAREERQKAPYMQLYLRYFEEQNDFFWSWPYEVKAAYSAEMLPLTEKLESLSAEVAETLVYRYGTPTEENIQHLEALQLARDTLSEEYKLTASELESYTTVYEAYDVTDPENPKWKFVFINPDDWYGTYYRVQLDAGNGEIILHEQFEWQRRLKNEEYDMKFY